MGAFDEVFLARPVNASEVFALRDDLGQWLLDKIKDDWRTNAGVGMGDDFERGVFDIAEQMIVEWKVGRNNE